MSTNPGHPSPGNPDGQDGFGRPSGPDYGSQPGGQVGGPAQPESYPSAPQSAPSASGGSDGGYGDTSYNPVYGGGPGYGQQPPPGPQGYPQQGYPQQPNGPQQGFPQQGMPPQGYGPQGPMGPNGPMGPQFGGPGAPGQPPRKRTGLFVGIGVGALVLILIAVFGGIALFGNKDDTAGPGGQTSAPAAPKKPGDAVRGYLDALNSGKAANVLALSSEQPQDKTFLTDAVLASAVKKTPISAIDVTEPTSTTPYDVDVTYKIGEQTVSDSIRVEKVGSEWKVKQAWAEASVYQESDLPLYLNGVQAKQQKLYLFPGTYTASTGNSYISYGSASSVLVKSPEAYPSFAELQPTLTSSGKSAFVKTVKSAVSSCLKSSSLKPGCGLSGFRASSGVKVTNVKHSIASGSLDRMDVNISASDPFTAKSYPSVTIKTTAKCNGGSCTGLYNQYLGSVSVDLGGKPLKAVWS